LVKRKHSMALQMMNPDDELLTPREVAELFGVRTTTIARWAREGRLDPFRTPGGHRRYRRSSVRALIAAEDASAASSAEEKKMAEDAARLYEQGWSIRQVAARFDCGYTTMRRILQTQVTLRSR
jgi:excisionase family DNA binding protein